MNIKGLLLVLLMIGIICITVDIIKNDYSQPTKIIYRYVPRTFDQEQDEPVYPSEIFKTMFTQPTAWIRSIDNYNDRKDEEINKYFISGN